MPVSPARAAAVDALIDTARSFPDPGPPRLVLDGLSRPDAALATAIYRTAVQRWLTLEHLLDRAAKKPMAKTPPPVRAVLLAGAAQLLFLPGVADYAAVDEAVTQARDLDHPHAAGAINAVLRQVAGMVGERRDTPWEPARDALPIAGGWLQLTSPLLPRTDNLLQHLAVATSHPLALVTRWHRRLGGERTRQLCLHHLCDPPTMVVDEAGACSVWTGPHDQLQAYLAQDVRRRVQDATAMRVVQSVLDLDPRPVRILDFCAGRGTKTRQLAVQFPKARIVAADTHAGRFESLRELADLFENVTVCPPDDAVRRGPFDLVLLDVPCSNTGVLARRAEAKYRATPAHLDSLVALQRSIVERVEPGIAPAGRLLYATCSIEEEENARQIAWISERTGMTILAQSDTLPGGEGPTYHDGGCFALLQRRAKP